MIHIGKAMKWARRSFGLSRAQFAKQIQCDRSWAYRLESGTSCPSHDFVEQAARMFGFANVEQMKCGCLPQRLSLLPESKMATLKRRLEKYPEAEQEIDLAKAGVRLPSEGVLGVMAKTICKGSVEDLLYGDLAAMVAAESHAA